MASTGDSWAKLKETRQRLEKCWEIDVNWSLYPASLREGCQQVGKALNLPPSAALCGYMILGSYVLSPAIVEVPGTDWTEPILLWLTVTMPTGSGKSTLFRHLYNMLEEVRKGCGIPDEDPAWLVDDASFEKMGALMHENSGRLLGLYDELAAFLSQIKLYRGGGLSESHELALFLQLFNGHHWRRDTVTGEANFLMESTRLTVGGFTQPGVARNLMDLPSNAEKGLSHRFLWVFPKPLYGKFDTLEKVDKGFQKKLVSLLTNQWRKADEPTKEVEARKFLIMSTTTTFGNYYDETQDVLKMVSGMDPLLEGLLSKSRGLVLRVATVLHLLFSIDEDGESVGQIVTDEAVTAAIDLVKLTCQQAAYMVGRGTLQEEIQKFQGRSDEKEEEVTSDDATAAFTLTLPGKTLYLSKLLSLKKYRNRGNKDGAVRVFYILEEEGLGKVFEVGGSKGASIQYEFAKAEVPEEASGRKELAKKLQKYNISLTQYTHSLKQKELKPPSPQGKRRLTDQFDTPTRKSRKRNGKNTPTQSVSPSQKNTTPQRNGQQGTPVPPSELESGFQVEMEVQSQEQPSNT